MTKKRGKTFTFQIVTTSSPQTFTLPIAAGGAGYAMDFVIDWGDTNSSIITSYDDVDKAHEYANAGSYDCVITGTCEYFGFNNAGDKTLLGRLDGLTGDVGLKFVNFNGCSNLNYIAPTMNLWSEVTSFYNCFLLCTSLAAIPAGLFDNNTLATSFYNCFYKCTSLAAIPAGLFDNNTLVTSFRGCFKKCTSLAAIPAGLFDNNTLATSFHQCFYNCGGITAIPAGLFDNNTLVTSFRGCFSQSGGITAIPAGLFDNNTLATNFTDCFYNCAGITALPDNLVLYNTSIDMVMQMFYNCPGIVAGDGTAFVDQATANGVSLYVQCFTGAINIPDYALIPAAWGGGGA